MENETPAHICRNCEYPLPEGAHFCPNCSQRNHDGRFTFREFLSEAIGNLFNLDNRIFRTLGALAVPGKLTVNYFQGKHIRYYHPLRLFFLTGLALISVLTFRYRQSESFTKMEQNKAESDYSYHKKQFAVHLDSVRIDFTKQLTSPVAIAAVDSFCAKVDALDAINNIRDSSSFNLSIFKEEIKGVKIATSDIMELPTDSILNKYHIKGYWNRMWFSRSIRTMKDTNGFLMAMLGNILWMMLIMMPLFALCLKLLYFRRGYYFYEHLVFSLHVHAAMFLALFILILASMNSNENINGWLNGLALVILIAYPYLAMKRVYKQSHLKTTLKYFMLNFAYLILAIFSIALMAMISFALF